MNAARLVGIARSASPRMLRRLVVGASIAAVLPAVAAWLGKRLVDAVVTHDRDAAFWLLGAEALAMLVFTITVHGGLLTRRLLGLRLGDHLRQALALKAASLELEELVAPEVQDQLSRSRKQAGSRPMAYLDRLTTTAKGLVGLALAAVLLADVHPVALVVVVLAGIPSFAVALIHAKHHHALEAQRTTTRREQGYLENVLAREDHAKEVRLLGIAQTLGRRFVAMADRLYQEQERAHGSETRAHIAAQALSTLAFYGAYFAVVWSTIEGRSSLGEMTMALVLFRQSQNAVTSTLQSLGHIARDELYLRDLFSLLDQTSPLANEGLSAGTTPGDGIRFCGVTFTYPGADTPALRDVSFHLTPGHVLGVVGENGSGKSTMLKLLVRLYDGQEGRITLDGLDLRQWNRAALWRRIAATFQDFARYKLTIEENVTLGDIARDEDDAAVAALSASGADELTRLGLAQRLGRSFPGGVDLSGGQWQKLALARAFFRESADIHIFDEPTAALDTRTEAKIFAHIYARTDAMSIVVAHRLAPLRRASEILVLHEGRVVERGDHDTLLAGRGPYAELFSLQAQSYADTAGVR